MRKLKIANNFSRYAHLYDKYALVQEKAAFELAGLIKNGNFSRILELGCGTGKYTLMLRERFTGARIKALDISEEMIGIARDKLKDKNVEFMIADAEGVIPGKDFDLITSNGCFQWLDGLDKALSEYVKLLQREGVIYFSIFGPRTFYELNTALARVLEKESINSARFYERQNLEAMLRDNFKSVKINEVCYKESFTSLKGLLEKIKYSGIRGDGLVGKVYFSRGLLEKIEKAYLDRFREIHVTYQVFFCRGEKR